MHTRLTPFVSSLALGTALVAGGCATTLPSQEPLPVDPVTFDRGELREAQHIIVVTDASGSTYFAETFPRAKALSQSFVKALPDQSARARGEVYNVGLIAFGGDDRVTVPLQGFDRQKLLSTLDGVNVMGSVDGFGGTTPIDKVIQEAGAELEGKTGQAAIVLFTDGEATHPDRALAAARKLVEQRPETCIHAVEVDDDPAGGQFLRDLAAISPCGSTRAATTVASSQSFSSFTKGVVVGNVPLPPVAAPAPASGCATIRLRGVNFAFDEAKIDDAAGAVLDVAAETLQQCRDVGVLVEGHTDATGTERYNEGLSERRARAVEQYLTGKGIEDRRLETRGLGESQPVASNETREGRALNRRVELKPQR